MEAKQTLGQPVGDSVMAELATGRQVTTSSHGNLVITQPVPDQPHGFFSNHALDHSQF